MFRSLLMLCGLFSLVVLLAEGVTVGLLWTRGALNPTAIREIRAALSGSTASDIAEARAEAQPESISQDEIRMARVSRILELESRENELALLKQSTSETANQLISEQRAFDELKAVFEQRLKQLQQQNRNEATEQIRAVLLASPPEEAVQRMMGLSKDESVNLLKGLPEKSIAKILQAFAREERAAARGQELFEALYRGEPTRTLLDKTQEQIKPSAGQPPPPRA